MRTVIYMLIIAVLLVGGCSMGRGESFSRAGYDFSMLDSVAIVVAEGAVKSEPAKNQIADLFAMELLRKGYAPKGRVDVEALLKEPQLQASELTTEAAATEVGAAEAGKMLNVPAVLIINIPHFDDEIFITAKMVDIEDGSILWLGSGSAKTGGLFEMPFSSTGAGAAVSSEDELFGGVVEGVLGGVTGYALSPKEAEQARRIIRRMCRTLPSRLTTEW